MATVHELTTLEIKSFSNAQVYQALERSVAAAGGRVVGVFAAEIGDLGRVFLLREFDDANLLSAARQKLVLSTDPLGCGQWLLGMTSQAYALFPFLAAPQSAAPGCWYEFRNYMLEQGKLAETIEAWQEAVPARHALSPLFGAFSALDGVQPGFLNVWAYDSLDERVRVRADAMSRGLWPPKGAAAALRWSQSTVCKAVALRPGAAM